MTCTYCCVCSTRSWWWTEKLSETCRVIFQKYIWEISACLWFYCKKDITLQDSNITETQGGWRIVFEHPIFSILRSKDRHTVLLLHGLWGRPILTRINDTGLYYRILLFKISRASCAHRPAGSAFQTVNNVSSTKSVAALRRTIDRYVLRWVW
jgi:hypothetical protein